MCQLLETTHGPTARHRGFAVVAALLWTEIALAGCGSEMTPGTCPADSPPGSLPVLLDPDPALGADHSGDDELPSWLNDIQRRVEAAVTGPPRGGLRRGAGGQKQGQQARGRRDHGPDGSHALRLGQSVGKVDS